VPEAKLEGRSGVIVTDPIAGVLGYFEHLTGGLKAANEFAADEHVHLGNAAVAGGEDLGGHVWVVIWGRSSEYVMVDMTSH
jgi:hypothetical protein